MYPTPRASIRRFRERIRIADATAAEFAALLRESLGLPLG
jgi:hypothetical protein